MRDRLVGQVVGGGILAMLLLTAGNCTGGDGGEPPPPAVTDPEIVLPKEPQPAVSGENCDENDPLSCRQIKMHPDKGPVLPKNMESLNVPDPAVDRDQDGVIDRVEDRIDISQPVDNCPGHWVENPDPQQAHPYFNPDQQDTDGDGVGDFCDNCVTVHNPEQKPEEACTEKL